MEKFKNHMYEMDSNSFEKMKNEITFSALAGGSTDFAALTSLGGGERT